MRIVGMEKSSFIDFPDKISTVYFTAGCNFQCPYCHNGPIVKEEGEIIKEEEVFSFLEKRKKFIDAICISGGEPTLHDGLYGFIKKVKEKGFLIKLDTNGTNPEVLRKLLEEELLDYVAMDIKAPLDKYEFITKSKVNIQLIKSSIAILREAAVDYEFRTTVCKELLTEEDILAIATYLKGSKGYFVQNFKDTETVLKGQHQFTPFDQETLNRIKETIQDYFCEFEIRK